LFILFGHNYPEGTRAPDQGMALSAEQAMAEYSTPGIFLPPNGSQFVKANGAKGFSFWWCRANPNPKPKKANEP